MVCKSAKGGHKGLTRDLVISASPTSDNLSPQETIEQADRETDEQGEGTAGFS